MTREDLLHLINTYEVDEAVRNELSNVLFFIDQNPEFNNFFLMAVSINQDKYKKYCEEKNNHLFREALGDACAILARQRIPKMHALAKFHCRRIRAAVFPHGIDHTHRDDEKAFYKKMGWSESTPSTLIEIKPKQSEENKDG